MEKQQRQVKFLLSPNHLLYATIIAEILGEMEFWSQPLQLYFPLNKHTYSGKKANKTFWRDTIYTPM